MNAKKPLSIALGAGAGIAVGKILKANRICPVCVAKKA